MDVNDNYAGDGHTTPWSYQMGIPGQHAFFVSYIYYWDANALSGGGTGGDGIQLEPYSGLSGQCS